MKFVVAITIGLMVVAFAGVATWLLFAGGAESQQERPELSTLSQEQLEQVGIRLSFPDQAETAISETQALALVQARYPEIEILSQTLAILERTPDNSQGGPVWVIEAEPSSVDGGVFVMPNGQPITRTTEAFLVFLNARTGEYLFDGQLVVDQ